MGCHSEAGTSVATGTNALFVYGVCVSELPVFAAQGLGILVSSVFNHSRVLVFLPIPSLAFDGVSSCRRLAGNQGTQFLTASSHRAPRSVSSVAWVLGPNPAQLCQKLESSEFKPLGYPSFSACHRSALYLP